MPGKQRLLVLILVASTLASASLCAQTASSRAPAAFVGCYDLTLGAWSQSLGVNAAYHIIPSTIQLDSAPATRGGWRVSPDIAYPHPSRFPGTPRWTAAQDSVDITWSNGFQVTKLRLGRRGTEELLGQAIVGSDANEFGTDLPRAEIVARRIPCVPTQ
jgi:hypothetical protein